eukprot:690128-Prymnesium_polylepis.1
MPTNWTSASSSRFARGASSVVVDPDSSEASSLREERREARRTIGASSNAATVQQTRPWKRI